MDAIWQSKWILSVTIPREYRPVANVGFERQQGIDKLVGIANALGQYPVFATENGIEVRGYDI